MKMFFSYFFVLHLTIFSYGKETPKYALSEIPEELKKNVNAVVRKDDMAFTITQDNRATLQSHFVVTIFNSKGNHFAQHSLWYSKLRKINKFEGRVYNQYGLLIREIRGNEVIDRGAYGNGSLHTDTRIKSINLANDAYPFTVEFEYEVDYKFLYAIDGSYIVSDENVSVQSASYKLTYPTSLKPRYKTYNIDTVPKVVSTADGRESVSWNFQNIQAIKFEPMSDHLTLLPRIAAAPGKFDYDGYPGSMETWDEYGKWQGSLNKGRDVLTEGTKHIIRQLTNGLETNEQKVRTLYEYLQSRTRYVNISLGIGGLQPFEAKIVDEVGYGDCKGLSNFMVAMLKEIGIKGYYCKIMAGNNAPDIDISFPSHQTNHIIVAVPNGQDTLWLECTSQTNPFNYLGTFTGDRRALMVTDEGGKIVNTHKYAEGQNAQSRVATVTLQLSGDAKATVRTVYHGLLYENEGLDFILNQSYEQQKKWLLENTAIPAFDILRYAMHNKKDKIPSALVNIDLDLKRWATTSGKRMFITPNIMNRLAYVPPKVDTRLSNVVTRMTYSNVDTIKFILPESIYPEFVPEPVVIKSRFGEYNSWYEINANEFLYVRKLKINKGQFPAESYKELTDFYKSINKADNTKIVFMSKT
jgi:hypothetical protein